MTQKKRSDKGAGVTITPPARPADGQPARIDEFADLAHPDGDLTQPERDRWLGAVELLREGETLTQADRAALRVYARTRVLLDRVEAQLGADGLVVATKNGYLQPSPLLGIASDLRKQLLRSMTELGLTPKSRKLLLGSAKSQSRAKGWRDVVEE